MRIALVTFHKLPDLDPDDRPLAEALARRGHEAVPAVWDDPAHDWRSFDVAVLRSTWDYFRRRDEFLAWAERAAESTRLLNPLELVRWNTHKGYLIEMADRGVPVIPTRIVPAGGKADLAALLRERGWAHAVVKPAVGADGFGTIRADASDAADGQRHLDAVAAHTDVMVQPYFASVEEPGERCLVFIGGELSHAVRKRSLFLGGRHVGPEGIAVTPAEDERHVASAALHAAGAESALYARVDLARDEDGRPRLMELELVEPTLFFREADGSADRMAAAIEQRAR